MSTNPGVTSRPSASISRRAGPSTRPTSVMRPPDTATSAVRAGPPVPSTTVPPLITRSCMPAAPSPARMSGGNGRHGARFSPEFVVSQPLDDGHVGLAAPFAHGLEAVAAAGSLELVQQRGHQPRPGGTQRMTQRDGAAVDVDLVEVSACLLLPCQHDGCECLVDLH